MTSKKPAASKRANLPRASDYTKDFLKDWQRLSHSGRYDMNRLKEAMTLLIAMEFKHSIVKVALRKESIIQVKTVILIAILALARKFIILEPDVDPAKVAALAGTVLALGLTYWLMRERDDRKSE